MKIQGKVTRKVEPEPGGTFGGDGGVVAFDDPTGDGAAEACAAQVAEAGTPGRGGGEVRWRGSQAGARIVSGSRGTMVIKCFPATGIENGNETSGSETGPDDTEPMVSQEGRSAGVKALVRVIGVSFVLLNAILYSCVLPLWEGFDEPFHYGYVQNFANGLGFPDPRTTRLSREIEMSLLLAPASIVVRRNLPRVTTYSEFFAWPSQRRASVRDQLGRIPPESRWRGSEYVNYEAHQAPLAYMVLAVPERMLANLSLPLRVLALRILAAIAGSSLLYAGAMRLFGDLRVPATYKSAACFCVFSCQMTWATVAHIANDWLALPLTLWFLSLLIAYRREPTSTVALRLSVVLSAGLLAKAYFLAFIPTLLVTFLGVKKWKHGLLVATVVLALAGPWYVRNLARYGALSGMQETRSGIPAMSVLASAARLDWPAIAVRTARWALWTGNNSFEAFSTTTLDATLLFAAIGLILWAIHRQHEWAEWITAAHCGVFLAALVYVTLISFIYTKGVALGPSPWYSSVLLPPLMGLAFLGCSRAGLAGRIVAGALVVLFGYTIVVTYAAKLIPLYGGFTGRTSLAALVALYSSDIGKLRDILNSTLVVPATIVLMSSVAVGVLVIVEATGLLQLLREAGMVRVQANTRGAIRGRGEECQNTDDGPFLKEHGASDRDVFGG